MIKNKRGFTLIEILVSLSIFAVLVTLLYGTFRSTTDLSEALDKRADSFRLARVAFYHLTKDLSMIYQKPPNNQAASGASPGLETESLPFGALRLEGTDQDRQIEGGTYPNDTLAFTSFAHQPIRTTLPIFDVAEISYSLSGKALVRSAQFREERVPNTLGQSVLGLNIRYFDGKEKKWLDEWVPSPTQGLPLAIEVQLTLEGPPIRTFETTTQIPFGTRTS